MNSDLIDGLIKLLNDNANTESDQRRFIIIPSSHHDDPEMLASYKKMFPGVEIIENKAVRHVDQFDCDDGGE